jgi:hypothetical protein
MKLIQSRATILIAVIAALMFATAAPGSQGKGGKGDPAAVGINAIGLINGKPILAEISGGGFQGDNIEVTLDGSPLVHFVDSAEMIIAEIPENTEAGDHEITVKRGDDNKDSASATITLGGEMIVSCISWFVSGPNDEHVHTEVHVEDENGNPVIDATVTWQARIGKDEPYQENTSVTYDNDGHAAGENCANEVSGSGVTGWFCCIGAGKWDAELPPGKRACSPGTYNAEILNVLPPPFTNMVWNPKNRANELEASYELIDTKFP